MNTQNPRSESITPSGHRANVRGACLHPASIVGFAGAALIVAGVFAPFMSVPIFGSVTYLQSGEHEGIILLFLAIVAALMVNSGRTRHLWVPGLLCGAVLLITYSRVKRRIAEAPSDLSAGGLDIFADLGEAIAQSARFQWGFGLLLIGILVLGSASFVARVRAIREATSNG